MYFIFPGRGKLETAFRSEKFVFYLHFISAQKEKYKIFSVCYIWILQTYFCNIYISSIFVGLIRIFLDLYYKLFL